MDRSRIGSALSWPFLMEYYITSTPVGSVLAWKYGVITGRGREGVMWKAGGRQEPCVLTYCMTRLQLGNERDQVYGVSIIRMLKARFTSKHLVHQLFARFRTDTDKDDAIYGGSEMLILAVAMSIRKASPTHGIEANRTGATKSNRHCREGRDGMGGSAEESCGLTNTSQTRGGLLYRRTYYTRRPPCPLDQMDDEVQERDCSITIRGEG